MATILLSAVGAAVGAGVGGTVLGLSGAVIGRAVGATIGQAIDRKLFSQKITGGGSDAVEMGRIDRLRIMGASEGAGLPRLWGRQRVAGQVIWATRFKESAVTTGGGGGGGKGGTPAPADPEVTTYSYSISMALALCEGVILRVGRVWADGNEIDPSSITMRVYTGTQTQTPDPKIAAVEGSDVPAFRGTAYVVIEDLALAAFGNRVPQLSFEVIRAAQGAGAQTHKDLSRLINGVAMIPATGEYALATSHAYFNAGLGRKVTRNKHTIQDKTDFSVSLEDLDAEMPQVASVSLVVAWFGDDLRCGTCTLRPKVEQTTREANIPWQVAGLTRGAAQMVAQLDNRPVYGGTPTDASVIEAIRAIKDQGKDVTFYPFILMDQLDGNGRPDPYAATGEQPKLPWRGRITTAKAPGIAGSTDGTAAATTEVDDFFGSASLGQFSHTAEGVVYTGPDEWRYRRFILHYAHLCAAAGGVESFCIGSEMRGLTQARGGNQSFPAVTRLRALAADVRAILGAGCKITYAADWSEYFGYHADNNIYFHLDPLWADANIDYIGIDNYMPLADWREGSSHADAAAGSIYNLDYLRGNIAGGEGFAWYYASPADEAAQTRTPIVDSAWGEDWIYRYKDLRGWWQNYHYPRAGGVRSAAPSPWVPASKPIRFTEYGCAAIDKGANQPNRFLDPKSSESGVPKYSTGQRDDLMQLAYFQAMHSFWTDPNSNPTSAITGQTMLDFGKSHAWAWDARPFPAFPRNSEVWADGANYHAGHWLNGRSSNQHVAAVLGEISHSAGVSEIDTSRAMGLVRGYAVGDVSTPRADMQPLLLAHAIEAVERGGVLRFQSRAQSQITELTDDDLVRSDELGGAVETQRSALGDDTGRLRLGYIEAEGAFAARAVEAIFPEDRSLVLGQSELPLVLTGEEAAGISERWLAEARIARDSARFALPKSRLALGAGDRVRLRGQVYRIDQIEAADYQICEAVRSESALYRPEARPYLPPAWPSITPDLPVDTQFLDLPLLRGDEAAHAPYAAAVADPWMGPVAVWSAPEDAGYALELALSSSAVMGVTLSAMPSAQVGVWDHGAPLRVEIAGGNLASISLAALYAGGNLMAIGDGDPANWELFQFANAALVAPNTYDLTARLRGQAGSDGRMPSDWPAGSKVVLITPALRQLPLAPSARGLARHYRTGLSAKGYAAADVDHSQHAFIGMGLCPYPVAHLAAVAVAGDLGITWIRRTRILGDGWEGGEVPLGEAAERYVLRLSTPAGALLREVALSAPSFTYTAAMRAADGAGANVVVAVAQVSEVFGPGPYRSITA